MLAVVELILDTGNAGARQRRADLTEMLAHEDL
jgi:hypothetical protein